MSDISDFGWTILAQLAQGPVWDGDLVCKSGRDELVRLGLAQRKRMDRKGFMINELTQSGLAIAAQISGNMQTGKRH